jgi:transmembrane sensor
MDKQLFNQLVEKYLDGSASADEIKIVEAYYEEMASQNASLPTSEKELIKKKMQLNIQQRIQPAASVSIFSNWWKTAAAVLVFATAGIVWQLSLKKAATINTELTVSSKYKNDITPAKGSAVLTLSGGSKIILDSIANGTLITNTSESIVKQNGQLIYKSSQEVFFNTLSTDKGKNYHLTLADGTEVWLDALSSINFPTAFPGKQRVVELTGQAYFEVAHNNQQPFKVKVGEKNIEVLGTHFNINAYDAVVKTTLLEGSVKIKSVLLLPGEQAQEEDNATVKIIKGADLGEVMAWKNGQFKFTGTSIEKIFAQLSRWYDIDVIYQDKINELFVANISRDMPVSKVLNLFEMTKQIKFKIDGNRITIMR